MEENEMKKLGEEKIKNEIFSKKAKKQGKTKQIGSTQIGQQMILDEAIRITPTIWQWINEKTWKVERDEWLEIFKDEKTTTSLIMSSFVLVVGRLYILSGKDFKSLGSHFVKNRHKAIESLDEKVFRGSLGFDKTFRFIEVLVNVCYFLSKENAYLNENDHKKSYIKYTCSLSDDISKELSMKSLESFYPLPKTSKPKHWKLKSGKIYGGYNSYQYDMVRTKHDKVDYSQYSDKIFKALNYIQSTRWKINEDVLDRVEDDLKKPVKEDYIKVKFPKNTDNSNLTSKDKENLSLYNAEKSDYESALGKWRSIKMAIEVAKKYIGKDLYFPHNYDFRGRIYPIPILLNPQGSDAIKSMLEFAEGEVLNKDGEGWCWAYLASLYGDDKITFIDRVARGKELIDADYKEADEPYQFLAHQIELQKYVLNHDYPVKTRIHLDACNSGSAISSAITGDLKGCKLTNVIPHPDGERQDAYQEVANISLDYIKNSKKRTDKEMFLGVKSGNLSPEGYDQEQEFLINLFEENGRKLCKRPVMVSNYGGTAGGRMSIIFDLLRELEVGRENTTKSNAAKLSKITGNAIEGALIGGKLLEKYIQEMNNIIAKKGHSISWYTGDGFYVNHRKNKMGEVKNVSCLLPNGKTTFIKSVSWTKDVDPRKMKSAISPNFIHSLDAMLLRSVALKMKTEGIKNTSWIHDSFGTSPNNVSLMLEITKKEFIKMVQSGPLKQLDEQLKTQAKTYGAQSRVLNKVKYPKLRQFSAVNDLKKLMKSEWFFS